MHTISHESIFKEFSRKLKLAAKILILYTRKNTCLVMLKVIPINSIFVDAEQKYYTEVYKLPYI